jgi:hypothetical protein
MCLSPQLCYNSDLFEFLSTLISEKSQISVALGLFLYIANFHSNWSELDTIEDPTIDN